MITFRHASLNELEQVLVWAAKEGWNPGLDDAAAFYAADPKGFFVAVEGGAPIAAISVVNHNEAFSFLGLYIVTPAHRGKGIGYDLWKHAIEHTGGRTIGLDGVPEQQSNYVASGFIPSGSTMRFIGRIVAKHAPEARLAQPDDLPELIQKEAAISGALKETYLSAWFTNTPNRKTLIVDGGFCTVRRCRIGVKIGPLVAENEAAARSLFQQASVHMGPHLIIDVPVASAGLSELCKRLDFAEGFETARMYRGPRPAVKNAFYAVTSLELG
ncbi:MAG: GNAT family N-acetyltransferase [Pseudomonadota bacterium]